MRTVTPRSPRRTLASVDFSSEVGKSPNDAEALPELPDGHRVDAQAPGQVGASFLDIEATPPTTPKAIPGTSFLDLGSTDTILAGGSLPGPGRDEALAGGRISLKLLDRRSLDVALGITKFLRTGKPPNQELALSKELGDAGLFGNCDTENERLRASVKWCLRVVNNEFDDPAARALASMANIALRDFVSVAMTTVLRQLLGHCLDGIEGVDYETMGYALAALPIVLQAVGEGQDRYKHRNTGATSASRALMALISMGTLAAAAWTGQLKAAAPTMLAFAIFSLLRDMSQRVLQTKDQLFALDAKAIATSSLAYFVGQTGINSAMRHLGSPSGSGTQSIEFRNAVIRGLLNWLGETGDGGTFSALHARKEGVPFQVRFSPQRPAGADLLDTFFGKFAQRFAAFMSLIQFEQVLGSVVEDKLSTAQAGVLTDVLGAMVLAGLYNPFVNSLNTKAGPSERTDLEQQTHSERRLSTAQNRP